MVVTDPARVRADDEMGQGSSWDPIRDGPQPGHGVWDEWDAGGLHALVDEWTGEGERGERGWMRDEEKGRIR